MHDCLPHQLPQSPPAIASLEVEGKAGSDPFMNLTFVIYREYDAVHNKLQGTTTTKRQMAKQGATPS